VEFILQSGDLTSGGFQRRDRAQLGTRGHQRVQRSRPEGYEAEVEIAYRVEGADPPLEIRGRIDGLYASKVPVILEEIKTTTLSLEHVNEEHNPLHWAQAQCYAYMYARQQHVDEIDIHLTYYHLDSGEEKTFERCFTLAELETFFRDLVTPYLDWFRKVHARQAGRDRSIQNLEFPYEDYRPGQREMAVAVYKAIRANDRLYVQSPTGVGKTIATLFPAVKALGQGLAAKNLLPDSQNVGTPGGGKGAGGYAPGWFADKKRDPDGQGKDLFLSTGQLRPGCVCICPGLL
jgi:DNA excision repair protein ERCC-2